MPKKDMDYSKMVIYKICCKDLNITDIYIGHTCNLVNRRWHHKNCCNNEKSKDYNKKAYQFIRANGGWDNWSVIEVDKCPCLDFEEALKIERYYIETLNATLNMVIPTRTFKEYYFANKEKRLENHKKWVNENLDKLKKYAMEYREKNRERILERDREKSKKYRENNKEIIAEKAKVYREKNKERILEKITCECGSVICKNTLSRHIKLQKHLKLMK